MGLNRWGVWRTCAATALCAVFTTGCGGGGGTGDSPSGQSAVQSDERTAAKPTTGTAGPDRTNSHARAVAQLQGLLEQGAPRDVFYAVAADYRSRWRDSAEIKSILVAFDTHRTSGGPGRRIRGTTIRARGPGGRARRAST